MSAPANLAVRAADRLGGLAGPWDVFAERSRRFEIHLNGLRVELTRGPIVLEGYGLRLLRGIDGQTGVGYQASTDPSDEGVRAAVEGAEKFARFNQFPAHHPELPSGRPPTRSGLAIVDPALWSNPSGALEGFAAALVAGFEGRKGVVPSFSSVKATLVETSIANSAGLAYAYAHTVVETEVAVKAFGGPEGRPPGEYWFTDIGRRLDVRPLPTHAADWSRFAEDARHAGSTPNGEVPVVLPPEVLAGIIPTVLRFQFGAAARLRGLGVVSESQVGAEGLHVLDDGLFDWGVGSSPLDDEGTPQRKRELVSNGRATELLFDVLHADALGATSTGSGVRTGGIEPSASVSRRFTRRPMPDASTIVIPAGNGGTDAEVIEQVEDGIWVQQIGWAEPDGLSGRFGGEIRIGYRIRHGKLAEPVRGGTVGGVVVGREGTPSLLHDLGAIGSKPELNGSLSSPTLLIRSLPVSGDDHPSAATTR
jgi:predicted Zn-dependent protease